MSDHFDSDRYEVLASECPRCGGHVQSPNEYDGLCDRCAFRVETPGEALALAGTRAKAMGECLERYLKEPERYEWTPENIYDMACRAAHNGNLALSYCALEDGRCASCNERP